MIPAAQTTDTRPRPYAPSWLDRLLDGIEALPGPAPLAYLALAVAAVVVLSAEPWRMGAASPFAPMEKLYWGGMIGSSASSSDRPARRSGPVVRAHRHWPHPLRQATIKNPLEVWPCSRDSS